MTKKTEAGKYAEGLNGYEQSLCYGIAFFQKPAKVRIGG